MSNNRFAEAMKLGIRRAGDLMEHELAEYAKEDQKRFSEHLYASLQHHARSPIGVVSDTRVDKNGDLLALVTLGGAKPSTEKLVDSTTTPAIKLGDRVEVTSGDYRGERGTVSGFLDPKTNNWPVLIDSDSGERDLAVSRDELAIIEPAKPGPVKPAFTAGDRIRYLNPDGVRFDGAFISYGIEDSSRCFIHLDNHQSVDIFVPVAALSAIPNNVVANIAATIDNAAGDALDALSYAIMGLKRGAFLVGTDVTIDLGEESKLAAFNGRRGKVVRVDADGKHWLAVEGFERSTYHFDASELKAAERKETPKPVRRNPVPKFVPLTTTGKDADAVALFLSDLRVAAFVEKVIDYESMRDSGTSEEVLLSLGRAYRIAWDRNEQGWREECRITARRIHEMKSVMK